MNRAATPPVAGGSLVERDSGIVVPAHLAHLPEEPEADQTPRNEDGRRRLVVSQATRKHMLRAVGEFARHGVVIVLACRPTEPAIEYVEDVTTHEKVPVIVNKPIPGRCGEVYEREDEGGADPGFGCKCTRIHFLPGV